tara:strand:- start:7869 stop:8621 length:753 start_codon:yes stop_codon:yes gene_type:complete
MFKRRSNCAKCIDIYEKGLRNEPEFKKSLKKLNANEKKEIDKEIAKRRGDIHKRFGDIFRDEAQRMLGMMHSFDPSKSVRKTKRLSQQFRNAKKRSPTMSKKINRYERDMLDVLGADNENYSDPEDIDFRNQMVGVEKAKNILTDYNPDAYRRNIKNIEKHRKKISNSHRSTKTLSQSARKAGIKPYRYSARADPKADDDFTPPPKKKGFFDPITDLFTSNKKGGKRTRKRRKRKRTRKKRKRRRRKTRK